MGTFNWSPGIGDPSIMGWVTVLLYLVAAVSCWQVARGLRWAEGSDSPEIVVWRCLTALLLALGINKQLDLQSALTEAGRVVAYAQGWYGQRRIFQAGFIAVIAVLGLAGVIVLFRRTRHAAGATRLAALGAVLLVSFVVIRAASFHHFDRFIGARFLGLKWNWILEIDGIALMLIASVLRRPKGWGRNAPGDGQITNGSGHDLLSKENAADQVGHGADGEDASQPEGGEPQEPRMKPGRIGLAVGVRHLVSQFRSSPDLAASLPSELRNHKGH